MLDSQNRLVLKQKLLDKIAALKQQTDILADTPITDLEINRQQIEEIAILTETLEKLNSYPRPLLYSVNLLDGAWLLQYSTAREIRALKRLPWGFLVGKIYQIIDVNTASFENKAWVQHGSGLLSGYVRVTAEFEPALEEDRLPSRKINVDFQQRFIGINKVLGIKSKLLDPVKVVKAGNPQGRIPSLTITYIDETMRIGRGGDGSLFILTKV
jgi:hypothetical protein